MLKRGFVSVPLALCISGCAINSDNIGKVSGTTLGVLGGAAAGAAVGKKAGGDSGMLIGAVVGAAAGGGSRLFYR